MSAFLEEFPCLHLQVDPRWHDGVSIHCLVFNGQSLSILWHVSAPGWNFDKFTCVFICFFYLVTDRHTALDFTYRVSRDLVNSVMDSLGVHWDILLILVPLRAGREDEHFLYHSDTHLLSACAGLAQSVCVCAVEVVNGFSLDFPMKRHMQEMFCFLCVVRDGTDKQDFTVKLHHAQYTVCRLYCCTLGNEKNTHKG